MLLPTYRPPMSDELMYGWILELGKVNFPGDFYPAQKAVDIAFSFAKSPSKRHTHYKESIRKDCIRGLNDCVNGLRNHGYTVPSPEDIITKHTPIGVMGICRSEGTQGRYLHTMLSSVTEDEMAMPKLPDSVKKLHVCPMCLQNEKYLRVWHHIPGVVACAEHGIKLITLTGERDNLYKISKQIPIPASKQEIHYAQYCKSIYDYPYIPSLTQIRQHLIDKVPDKDKPFLYKKMSPFTEILRLMMQAYPCYQNLIKQINIQDDKAYDVNNSVAQNLSKYDVLHDSGNMMRVHCIDCGHVWTTAKMAMRIGLGCPECMKRKNPHAWAQSVLRMIGDGRYILTDTFQGMGATQEVFHETCGCRKTYRLSSMIWNGTACKCEKSHSVSMLQEKVNNIMPGYQVLTYTAGHGRGQGVMLLEHIPCKTKIHVTLQYFQKHHCCQFCQHLQSLQKLQMELGSEYKIIDSLSKRRVQLRHNRCGSIFITFERNLHREIKCPLCTPYLREKRRLGETYESRLYQNIKSWFRDHNYWVSKRHRKEYPEDAYYHALQTLVRKGYLYRISDGVYRDRKEYNVYDVLRERYLVDDSGGIAGVIINDAAGITTSDSLRGNKNDNLMNIDTNKLEEQNTIVLVSTLLKRRSPTTSTVCGRKVILKGINVIELKDYLQRYSFPMVK